MLSSPQQEDCLLLTIIGQGLKTNVNYVASVALKGTGMRHLRKHGFLHFWNPVG